MTFNFNLPEQNKNIEDYILWLAEDDNFYDVIKDIGIEKYSEIILDYIGDDLQQAVIDLANHFDIESFEILKDDVDENGKLKAAINLEYYGYTDTNGKNNIKMHALCTLLNTISEYCYIFLDGTIDYEYDDENLGYIRSSGFRYKDCDCNNILLVKYPSDPKKQKNLLRVDKNDILLTLSDNNEAYNAFYKIFEHIAEDVDLDSVIKIYDGPSGDPYDDYRDSMYD